MITENFYTGEPVITGSPPIFSETNLITNASHDEIEAANDASFGRYDYDPGMRRTIPTAPVSFGGQGYFPYQQQPGYYPQQPMGIGMSPYGNPLPTYGMYNPNPVLQQGYNPYQYGGFGGYYQPQQYQYQQPQMPTTMHIPGVNFSGTEYMPPADYQKRIDELEREYWEKQQELDAKQVVDRQAQSSYYGTGYGYNYYGYSYYNPYQYNSLNNELSQKVQEIKDEARENRMQFNLQIARLAHNFSGQTISEEALEERYRGRTIDIPRALIQTPQEMYDQSRLFNMVPFDNSQQYRDFHAAVSREFNTVISPDANLKDTFAGMGVIAAQWEMEDEMHRRRNAAGLYQSGDSGYKYFVRKKAQERYAKSKGIQIPGLSIDKNGIPVFNAQQANKSYLDSLPTLSQNATLADDGTLNISVSLPCNVGSHRGENYTVYNQQESAYDEKRARFGSFLDTIPGSIYLDQEKQRKLEDYSG